METLVYDQPDITDQERLENLKVRDDVVTLFSEMLDGNMRTKFDFELSPDGQELRGRDGRGLAEIAQDSLDKAEEMAAHNPNLGWNLRRTRLEQAEIAETIAMANGEGPNTIIVPSDFVPELWNATEDFGGYNVTRKQTMLRILTRRPDGNIVDMTTQTLDGSNRQALEAIYAEFGIKPKPGELLGQRIRVDLTAEEQATLADRLTGVYDRSLAAQYDGEWYAGRRPADYRNTYDFVCGQAALVNRCVQLERRGQLTDKLMYDMAATMQRRFEEQKSEALRPDSVTSTTSPQDRVTYQVTYDTVRFNSLDEEIMFTGQKARAEKKTFSGCGGTLKAAGDDDSTEARLRLAGYGGKLDPEAWHGGSIHRNAKCNSCEKVKSEVGACHICKDCVNNPSKRSERYKAYQVTNRAKAKAAKLGSAIIKLWPTTEKPEKSGG